MPSQERKTVLELPLKVVLTQEATSVFIRQNKKLTKFKLADDVDEYGLQMDRFAPASIQRLLLADYISKIEVSRAEFVSCRQELMDLTKLLVYGMLYRQYDATLFTTIISSELIKRWNRSNPGSIIDEKTRFNESFLQTYLKEHEITVAKIREELLAPFRDRITKNPNLLPDEMNIQVFLSEKFLSMLRPFSWFILVKFRGVEGYELLARDVRATLAAFMEKSCIAEYVALIVMELAINAENANLKKEAALMFQNNLDINSVLYDPNTRKKVVEELTRKDDLVYIAYKIGGTSSSIGTQGRIQITLYNKEREYREIKDSIESKKSADLKKKSLTDFYRELPEAEADSQLGLYYLSYLSEACEKVAVKFESFVNQIKSSDTTVINLSLNI